MKWDDFRNVSNSIRVICKIQKHKKNTTNEYMKMLGLRRNEAKQAENNKEWNHKAYLWMTCKKVSFECKWLLLKPTQISNYCHHHHIRSLLFLLLRLLFSSAFFSPLLSIFFLHFIFLLLSIFLLLFPLPLILLLHFFVLSCSSHSSSSCSSSPHPRQKTHKIRLSKSSTMRRSCNLISKNFKWNQTSMTMMWYGYDGTMPKRRKKIFISNKLVPKRKQQQELFTSCWSICLRCGMLNNRLTFSSIIHAMSRFKQPTRAVCICDVVIVLRSLVNLLLAFLVLASFESLVKLPHRIRNKTVSLKLVTLCRIVWTFPWDFSIRRWMSDNFAHSNST